MTGTQDEWDDYAATHGALAKKQLDGYVYCPEGYTLVATLTGDYYAEIDEQFQCQWADQGYLLCWDKTWLRTQDEWDDYAATHGALAKKQLDGYVYCPEGYTLVATLTGDYYAEIDEQFQCQWADQGYLLCWDKTWLNVAV
jgi:hypothetical protein